MEHLPIHTKAVQPGQGQRLPNELLLHVVSFLKPAGPEFLPASHQTTKTLLALMRLCRTANEAASAIFSRHCIHLDSEDRTLRFARCLSLANSHPMPGHKPPFSGITSIFMESFMEYTEEEGTLALVELDEASGSSVLTQDGNDSGRSVVGSIDIGEPDDDSEDDDDDDFRPVRPHPEVNDLPVATAVHDIFIAVAPTLQRLMVNIPLRSLYPEHDDFGVKAVLRRGFESLVNLEEFVSVKDELFVTTTPDRFTHPQDEVWATCWPKLRRLYLYNPMIEESFWRDVLRTPKLDRIMMGRPDGNHHIEPGDIKRGWIAALAGQNITTDVYHGPIRPLTYINVELRGIQPSMLGFRSAWRTLDPDGRIRVLAVDTPPEDWLVEIGVPVGEEPCPRDSVHTWVRNHILAGTLWDEDAIGAYDPLSQADQGP